MTACNSILAAGSAALAIGAAGALAQAPGPTGTQGATGTPGAPPAAQDAAVVVIVRVPRPWYAPRLLVAAKMRDTIPQYAQLQGLLFKAFSFERDSGDYGGLYYWRQRSAADAWFNTAWFERVRKQRGAQPQVRTFEAVVTLDNTAGGTPADSDSKAVATLVEISIPAGITRERLAAEFRAAVPTYQQVPGLLRKHFTVSADHTFGGIYLWKDEASARAWFNEAWHARVMKTYGQDARIEWFDTPILLPTAEAAGTGAGSGAGAGAVQASTATAP